MKLLGLDENGYGPLLGPLVVTGVLIEKKGPAFPSYFKDSKELFKGRRLASYKKLESAALQLLLSVVEKSPGEQRIPRPLWIEHLPPGLEKSRILGITSLRRNPGEINRARAEGLSKAEFNFRGFWEIISRYGEDGLTIAAGKIGGTTYKYARWLSVFAEEVFPEQESSERSSYRIRYRGSRMRIAFLKDGESKEPAIALASIVGKYRREEAMLTLCRELGYPGKLPFCSGYHGDPATHEMVGRIRNAAFLEQEYIRLY